MARRSSVIRVSIVGDASQLTQAFGEAERRSQAFGQRLKSAGDEMTRNLTVPLVAAGGAAAKLAMDFESSMAKIEGLVGIAGSEVAAMGEQVRALAGETAQAPGELADALFFVTSAGLRGSDALSALEASAKASTAGLGETKTVADAVTSAMNAYAASGLTAADATDILVATVREGKLEASDLAGSIGRVLPLASELGVSFNDVGAAIAAMTRLGSDAAESTTALRAIFVTLAKPGAEAQKTLAEMGLSAGGLREQLREKGLLSVLQTLAETFDGNEEALAKVIPNVRALTGFLNLTGGAAEAAEQIFDRMQDTTGMLGSAFDAVAKTDAFALKQALSDVKADLIPVGTAVLTEVVPALQALGNTLSTALEWFNKLEESTQESVVKYGLLVAAVGPVLSMIGRLITSYKNLRVAALGAAAAQAASAAGGVGGAVGAGALAAGGARAGQVGAGAAGIRSGFTTSGLAVGSSGGATLAAGVLGSQLGDWIGSTIASQIRQARGMEPKAESGFTDSTFLGAGISGGTKKQFNEWFGWFEDSKIAIEDATKATGPYLDAQEEAARLTRLHAEEQSELQRFMRHLPPQVEEATGQVQKFNDESRWFIRTLDDGSRVLEGIGTDFSELGQAVANETPKILEGAGALMRLADGARESVEQILALKAAAEGFAVDIGSLQTTGGPSGGRAAPRAGGGRFEKGQMLLTGEHGPELVRFDSGGTVLTNQQSRRLAAGGGGVMPAGGSSQPPIYIGNVYGWDDFVRKVREAGVDINRLGWS